VILALLVALVPLVSLLGYIVAKGYPYLTWHFLTTEPAVPSLLHRNDIGGIANAISGTITITGIAILISVPFAILVGVGLYEFRGGLARMLEFGMEAFVGMPSITFGVFIYAITVALTKHFEAWYGSLALCLIIIPVGTVNLIAALRSVPITLKEAGLSLGARPSRLMWHVILPTSRPRILTGFFLSIARSLGETAPVLFVIGASTAISYNPRAAGETLPTQIYTYLTSPYPSQRNACWGIALILIIAVMVFSVASRALLARTSKK
jgi:phosphate transport system permease protein